MIHDDRLSPLRMSFTFFFCLGGFSQLYVPIVLNALLAAVGDMWFYKLCRRCFDEACSSSPRASSHLWRLSLLLYASCWSVLYVLPRSLSNSVEAILCMGAWAHWQPWPLGRPRQQQPGRAAAGLLAVACMGAAVLMRPTAAIQFVPAVLWTCYCLLKRAGIRGCASWLLGHVSVIM